jgi:hypothetical protein
MGLNMSESLLPIILGVTALRQVEVIDKGTTLAVRFVDADEREVVVLVPYEEAAELSLQLPISLLAAQRQRRTL